MKTNFTIFNDLHDYYLNEKNKSIKTVLLSVIIFSFLTNGYCYFNSFFSHDSINTYTLHEWLSWEFSLGRFGQGFVSGWRGFISVPFVIGIFSIIFLTLSTLLLINLLSVKKTIEIILISGIISTNSIIYLWNATYICGTDVVTFALLLNIFAVFLCEKYKKGWILSILFIVFSLTLYQAYIEISVTLFMFICLQKIAGQEKIQSIIIRILKYLCIIIVSLLLYFILIKVFTKIGIIKLSNSYNGLTDVLEFNYSNIVTLFLKTYRSLFNHFIFPKTLYAPVITFVNIIVLGYIIFSIIYNVIYYKISKIYLCLYLLIILLFPFGMNFVYVISNGMIHDLMFCTMYFLYIFAICLNRNIKKRDVLQVFVYIFIFVVIFNNFIFANHLYLKKDLESKASLSVMTRILYQIEAQPDYECGKTPICFVGDINNSEIAIKRSGFKNAYKTTGNEHYYSFTYNPNLFIQDLLGYPINSISLQTLDSEMQIQIKEMPCFPNKGYITSNNGIIIVKLSNEE